MVCSNCGNRKIVKHMALEEICEDCFEKKFGKIIFSSGNVVYTDGDSNISKKSVGSRWSGNICSLFFTEKNIIFSNYKAKDDKKWDKIIPLESIVVNYWDPNKTLGRMGQSWPILVIPYEDSNGKLQKPRFYLNSYSANASSIGYSGLKKWQQGVNDQLHDLLIEFQEEKLFKESKERKQVEPQITNEPKDKSHELYDQLDKGEITMEKYAEEIKKIDEETPTENKEKSSDEEYLKVLKMRYVKGEISKEEFNEIKEELGELKPQTTDESDELKRLEEENALLKRESEEQTISKPVSSSGSLPKGFEKGTIAKPEEKPKEKIIKKPVSKKPVSKNKGKSWSELGEAYKKAHHEDSNKSKGGKKSREEELEEYEKKYLKSLSVKPSELSEADNLKKEIEILKEKLEIHPKKNVKPKKSKGGKKSREEELEEYEKKYLKKSGLGY